MNSSFQPRRESAWLLVGSPVNDLDTREETMVVTDRANVDVHSSYSTNNDSGFLAKQSFPPDGLVAMSRIAYQNTSLSTEKIGEGIFVFRCAGGNVRAISGLDGCQFFVTG